LENETIISRRFGAASIVRSTYCTVEYSSTSVASCFFRTFPSDRTHHRRDSINNAVPIGLATAIGKTVMESYLVQDDFFEDDDETLHSTDMPNNHHHPSHPRRVTWDGISKARSNDDSYPSLENLCTGMRIDYEYWNRLARTRIKATTIGNYF